MVNPSPPKMSQPQWYSTLWQQSSCCMHTTVFPDIRQRLDLTSPQARGRDIDPIGPVLATLVLSCDFAGCSPISTIRCRSSLGRPRMCPQPLSSDRGKVENSACLNQSQMGLLSLNHVASASGLTQVPRPPKCQAHNGTSANRPGHIPAQSEVSDDYSTAARVRRTHPQSRTTLPRRRINPAKDRS